MVEDLLGIANDLLRYVVTSKDLEEDEREYIINVVRRAIFIIFIQLAEKTPSQNRF